MKNTLFMIIGSFLPLTLVKFFAEPNSSFPQPQQGASQGATSPGMGLEAFSLPAGAITENDLPQIKLILTQVLKRISDSVSPTGTKADYKAVKSGMLTFQDWLRRQGCISQASTTYDLDATDKYPDNIFMTYPGQLPFDIIFNLMGDVKKPYRLLVFITNADFFTFASLVENKSLGGVAVPESWPKDTWSYWENRI